MRRRWIGVDPSPVVRASWWLAGALAVLFALGCRSESPQSGTASTAARDLPRILLIGLDGADLRIIDTLAAKNLVPNLAGLMRRGVTAPLQTVSNASPVVWTSIATGVAPAKHGIDGFVRGPEREPVAATMRTRPAFWNILTHYGRSVGVLAWWATFPAEEVNGYVVSPYPPKLRWRVSDLTRKSDPGRVHPEELYAAVAAKVVPTGQVDPAWMRSVFKDALRTHETPWVVARDQTYFEIAKSLMETKPVEMVAVYFQGIDVASHDFSRYVFGKNVNRRRTPQVRPAEVRRGMERVYSMYSQLDRVVGALVDEAGPHADIVVVSDHGWEYDGTGHFNLNPGVFIAAGPIFRQGVRLDRLSVLDVLPMVLTILGVPLSRDFDGRVPEEVFASEFAPQPQWVDAYPMKAVSLADGVKLEPSEQTETIERLRGLGYIE